MNTPLRILILGDKAQAEDDIASVLATSALDPICIADDVECLKWIRRQETAPGLVLLNPSSQDSGALESIRTLRAAHPHLLLAVTGYSFDPSFIQEAAENGALLLRKPISPQDIEGLITRIRLNTPAAPPPRNSKVLCRGAEERRILPRGFAGDARNSFQNQHHRPRPKFPFSLPARVAWAKRSSPSCCTSIPRGRIAPC